MKVEKLHQVLNNFKISTDLLEYPENGKVNLGEVEPLNKIIESINNQTAYTAFYSNDYDGGLIIKGL